MQGSSTISVGWDTGGDQVAANVGLHLLGGFADRVGLGSSLSTAVPHTGERAPVHDRGTVLTQAMLMLAGGGEACSDIEHLRSQPRLFGDVASDSTLYRVLTNELTADTLAGVWAGFGEVRKRVWQRMGAMTGTGEVILDVDASLHQVHSERKQDTAPNYKGGFGYHPLYVTADATGEVLAVKLRPGNAGANTITDHLEVLDAAIAQLPEQIAVGHRPGDDSGLVQRPVRVRSDSAAGVGLATKCRERNLGFSFVAATNAQIQGAIARIIGDADRWSPAVRQDGAERKGAQVAELTNELDLSGWPEGTRFIVRREPRHPGAQQSLFWSETFRYWGHYTDTVDGDPVERDRDMRAHAHVEDVIARIKDSGGDRFPFTTFTANSAWLALVAMAHTLTRWFALLCLPGRWACAKPKTLRWNLWHAPARLVRKGRQDIIRVLDTWPAAHVLGHARAAIGLIT